MIARWLTVSAVSFMLWRSDYAGTPVLEPTGFNRYVIITLEHSPTPTGPWQPLTGFLWTGSGSGADFFRCRLLPGTNNPTK